MSTPASRRLHLALAAVGAAILVYAIDLAGLQLLVRHAERSRVVYPYKNEDWLRWLLPTLWSPTEKPLLLITGPSTARENIRIEAVQAAFPEYRVFQGGLSLGAMTDVMLGLRYVEREYGRAALPAIVILGVSPRFIADIPEVRPLPWAMATYSSRYVPDQDAGVVPALTTKPRPLGLIDEIHFFTGKQQGRYWAALASLVAGPPTIEPAPYDKPPWVRTLERTGLAGLLPLQRPLDIGVANFAREVVSPYRYEGARSWPDTLLVKWLDDSTSWWREVYDWDASTDAAARERIRAFLDFAYGHGMEVYVLNMPERGASRVRYRPELTRSYTEMLAAEFASTPLLDLRCALPDDQFMDAEHALIAGAREVTTRVIHFVRIVHDDWQREADGRTAKPTSAAPVAARWSAGC